MLISTKVRRSAHKLLATSLPMFVTGSEWPMSACDFTSTVTESGVTCILFFRWVFSVYIFGLQYPDQSSPDLGSTSICQNVLTSRRQWSTRIAWNVKPMGTPPPKNQFVSESYFVSYNLTPISVGHIFNLSVVCVKSKCQKLSYSFSVTHLNTA